MSRDIGYAAQVSMRATTKSGSIGVQFETVVYFGGDGSYENATLYLSFEGRSAGSTFGTFVSMGDPNKTSSVIIASGGVFGAATIEATRDPATGPITGSVAPLNGSSFRFTGTHNLKNVVLANKIGIAVNNAARLISPVVLPTIDDVSQS